MSEGLWCVKAAAPTSTHSVHTWTKHYREGKSTSLLSRTRYGLGHTLKHQPVELVVRWIDKSSWFVLSTEVGAALGTKRSGSRWAFFCTKYILFAYTSPRMAHAQLHHAWICQCSTGSGLLVLSLSKGVAEMKQRLEFVQVKNMHQISTVLYSFEAGDWNTTTYVSSNALMRSVTCKVALQHWGDWVEYKL